MTHKYNLGSFVNFDSEGLCHSCQLQLEEIPTPSTFTVVSSLIFEILGSVAVGSFIRKKTGGGGSCLYCLGAFQLWCALQLVTLGSRLSSP